MNKKYHIAASIFRVYVAFHLFKKYLFYFFNRDLIYSKKSFFNHNNDMLLSFFNVDFSLLRDYNNIILTSVLILSLFFAFGIGKIWTNVALFLLVEILQRLNGIVLNGGDNFLKFILLYLCFINSYRYFALKKYTIESKLYNMLSYLGILSIKMHLCLIYFVSAIFKMNTKIWFSGVANYYIFNIERFMGTSYNTALSKNALFVTLSTYFTLFWELSFSFLIWFKKLKIPMLITGIFLHLGIYIFMMIHDFEILFISTYILFFTDKQILKFKNYITNKLDSKQKLKVETI